MSGKSLPIAYASFVHQVQASNRDDRPTISLSRAFTRLETEYCTFSKTPYAWRKVVDTTAAKTDLLATHIPLREMNDFWRPQRVYNYGESFCDDKLPANGSTVQYPARVRASSDYRTRNSVANRQ